MIKAKGILLIFQDMYLANFILEIMNNKVIIMWSWCASKQVLSDEVAVYQ